MYKDYQDVITRFKELGVYDHFGTKKEMKELPKLLDEDEIIEFANSGIVDGNTVLMVCTQKRILLIDKGMIFGIKTTEIPLENVIQVSYKKGLMFGEVHIDVSSGKRTSLKQSPKDLVEQMVKVIKEQKDLLNSNQSDNVDNAENTVEKIREFKKLMDEGIITEEEFNAKKQQLLNI